MKKALITGITGQDGSYLAELLLDKGYEVWGIVRRSSDFNTSRIDHLLPARRPRAGASDSRTAISATAARCIASWARCGPDEVYNLGAQIHVRVSFEIPEYTSEVRPASAWSGCSKRIRQLGLKRALLSGLVLARCSARSWRRRRREKTPFHPRSPYAAAKVFAYHITRNYREAYGMFAVNGILFNHESPRRGENFVTRKITRGVARIKLGPAGQALRSATSRPSATGALPATTSRPCGGCCRPKSPTTT